MKKLVAFSWNTRCTNFCGAENNESAVIQARSEIKKYTQVVQLVKYPPIDCQTGVARTLSYVATLIDDFFFARDRKVVE